LDASQFALDVLFGRHAVTYAYSLGVTDESTPLSMIRHCSVND